MENKANSCFILESWTSFWPLYHGLLLPAVPLYRTLLSVLIVGCILGCPVVGMEIDLHDLQVGRGTSAPMITACVAQCIYHAISKASPVLLEPVMNLEVIKVVQIASIFLWVWNLAGCMIFFICQKRWTWFRGMHGCIDFQNSCWLSLWIVVSCFHVNGHITLIFSVKLILFSSFPTCCKDILLILKGNASVPLEPSKHSASYQHCNFKKINRFCCTWGVVNLSGTASSSIW